MKKIITILVLMLILIIGCSEKEETTEVVEEEIPDEVDNQLIGGETDELGCLSTAGYSWCEETQKCLHVVEETCSHICSEEEKAAQICTMEYMPVCGNDGITYGNGCGACAAGASIYVTGECESEVTE